jgi:hypothetical protein
MAVAGMEAPTGSGYCFSERSPGCGERRIRRRGTMGDGIKRTLLAAGRFGGGVLLSVAACTSGAVAGQTCPGTYQSSALSSLPATPSIQIQIVNQTPTNQRLAARFAAGLQSAGVAVSNQGNVVLNLVFTVGKPSGAARPYQDFGWADNLAAAGFGPGTTLNMTAQVTDVASAQIDWISSLSCTIQTDDPGTLAEYLGSVVGRSLGQSTDNGTI